MNPTRRPSPPPSQPRALRGAVALLLATQAASAVPAATAGAIHDSRIATIAAYARRCTDGLGARPDGEPVAITNCNDSGPGSLRQAMLDASDDVQLDLTALACSRISLTTGALTSSANVSLYAPIVFSEGRPGPASRSTRSRRAARSRAPGRGRSG